MERFSGSTTRHGTQSGWRLHQRRGEEPCYPCWLAKSEYDKRRKDVPEERLRNRRHASAQQRALKRLKDAHPEEYRQYYAEEKVRVDEEAELDD